MPSLIKDSAGRSPYWICAYTTADGRRLKKSTKVSINPKKGEKNKDGSQKTAGNKRTEALEVCLAVERAENSAKAGTLTEQALKKILSETLERTTGEALHSFTVTQWLDQWLTGKGQSKADKTAVRYRQVIRGFKESLGSRSKLSLGNITPKDIFTYRDSITSTGRAAKTANISCKIVSAAFNAAVRQGYIPNNPCTALEGLKVNQADKATFTRDQVSQLVEAAEGQWKGFIMMSYFIGARISDVARMQWEAVNFEKRTITFIAHKTQKQVTVGLHADLERHLRQAPGIGKAFIFPSLAGMDISGKSGLSAKFKGIVAKAKIIGKITKNGSRSHSSLTHSSLRHSFNSALADAGVSQEMRMKLTGHKSRAVNDNYTHIEIDQLRAAVNSIPGLSAKAGK